MDDRKEFTMKLWGAEVTIATDANGLDVLSDLLTMAENRCYDQHYEVLGQEVAEAWSALWTVRHESTEGEGNE